jgi:hypothetical protein
MQLGGMGIGEAVVVLLLAVGLLALIMWMGRGEQ